MSFVDELTENSESQAGSANPTQQVVADKTTVRELNKNQTMLGYEMTEALRSDPDALFNPKRPAVDLKHEKAEHRVIIMLKAQGFSNIEIARQMGYTPVSVNYIVNQPWAQKRIVEEIKRAGRDEVEIILKGTLVDSLNTLIAIRDDPDAKVSDRRSSAEYLVDRVLGKARQAIDHSLTKKFDDLSDEELAKIAMGTTATVSG